MAIGMELRITYAFINALGNAWSNLDKHHGELNKKTGCTKKYYQTALSRLQNQGLIQVAKRQGKSFIHLTEKGVIKALVQKAAVVKPLKWDGKFRVISFDIPEDAKHKRHELRKLLKQKGFYKLQASVFIHCYPLNREAVEYLKLKGLDAFIRIMRVDKIDDDHDLRKYFGLPQPGNTL